MKGLPPLFRYRNDDTILHHAPAGLKLAGMIFVTIGVFAADLRVLAVIGAVLAILLPIAKTSVRVVLRNFVIVFWYALFIAIFRLTGKTINVPTLIDELRQTGIYIVRLTAVLITGTLFYETTSALEIRLTLSTIQRVFKKGVSPFVNFFVRRTGREVDIPDIAFLLTLTITFIPRIFEAWESLNHAWDARGGSLRRGIFGAWRRLTVLVPLLVVKLLSIAADTDRAIRNRS